MLVLSLALLLVGQITTAPPTSQPVLQVGVFSYGPDGKPQAAAYATTLDTESLQYIAGCEIGGGNRPVPDRATDAWRLSGKVETLTAEEAVVRIDWQRIRAAKTGTTSPGGSVQLTLHPGDRVPLDSANPEQTPGCGSRTVSFEAKFEPRPGWMGAGTGSGSGSGAGGGSVYTGAISVQKPDPSNTSGRTYTAELFLVRTDKTQPEKPDFNMQGIILKDVQTANFAFSPFSIDTSAGPINVQISGLLRVASEGIEPTFVFRTIRTIRFAKTIQVMSSGATTDATGTATGSSTTRNPMPGPDDVLSFELPPIRVPNSSVTLPDQYSVRVRIR